MAGACQVGVGSVILMSDGSHDVVAALLVRDGRVLLGHRSPDREWYPDVWDIPGGHVEPDETGVAALVRELREELGIDAEVPEQPCSTAVADDLRLRVWRVDTWRGEPTNRAPEEHDTLGWFDVDAVRDLALAHPSYVEVITDALAVA
jgi:8-oxo-dGTP pyrophosphatase MutT (NUDIX family)